VALAAVALWACSAAIRLWRNACIAWAGSEAVVDELEDEELVDDEAGDALALEVEVLSPVAPICESASMMEFIKPPPDGGGGGGWGVAEVTSEGFVTSDCVLVLLVAASCASQLLMLETLLIVMSISASIKLRVNTT
jgi:hypothetical protein